MRSAFLRVTRYVRAGETLERHAVLFPPLHPSRKASDRLSRYDRLDPSAQPDPAPDGLGADVEGMERLRAALDDLADKVNARRLSENEMADALGRISAAKARADREASARPVTVSQALGDLLEGVARTQSMSLDEMRKWGAAFREASRRPPGP